MRVSEADIRWHAVVLRSERTKVEGRECWLPRADDAARAESERVDGRSEPRDWRCSAAPSLSALIWSADELAIFLSSKPII